MIGTGGPDSPADARAAALAYAFGFSVRTIHPEARPAVTPSADVTRNDLHECLLRCGANADPTSTLSHHR